MKSEIAVPTIKEEITEFKHSNISVEDVGKVILETVSEMSKFAIDKIKMEHHVDHELHMDSDKVPIIMFFRFIVLNITQVISLINTVQEKFGSPGLVNGRVYSYATLNEIAVSLQQALTTGVTGTFSSNDIIFHSLKKNFFLLTTVESSGSGGVYWVRNFVETYEESDPVKIPSPSLSQKKVLLLHIGEDNDLAMSISQQLDTNFSGVVNCTTLPSDMEQFGVIIALLPSASPSHSCNLMEHAKITLQLLVQAISAIQQVLHFCAALFEKKLIPFYRKEK